MSEKIDIVLKEIRNLGSSDNEYKAFYDFLAAEFKAEYDYFIQNYEVTESNSSSDIEGLLSDLIPLSKKHKNTTDDIENKGYKIKINSSPQLNTTNQEGILYAYYHVIESRSNLINSIEKLYEEINGSKENLSLKYSVDNKLGYYLTFESKEVNESLNTTQSSNASQYKNLTQLLSLIDENTLKGAIGTIVNVFATQTFNQLPTSKGNLYELYVYLLICTKIKDAYTNATTTTNDQPKFEPTGSFKFRGKPGYIDTSFSCFQFEYQKQTHQLWNGIEVKGEKMKHEMDIILFSSAKSNNCEPKHSDTDIKFTIECKNHEKVHTIKGHSRQLVGVLADISHKFTKSPLYNFKPCFVVPHKKGTTVTDEYNSYLERYDVNTFWEIRPDNNNNNNNNIIYNYTTAEENFRNTINNFIV